MPEGPLTPADLIVRWHISGASPQAVDKALRRRLNLWGLKPMLGTRGKSALFRADDVLRAEERAAAGTTKRRRVL